MKICNESVEPETSINKVIKLDIEAKESIYFSKELKLCLATEDQADRFVCDYSNEALAALLGIEDFAKDESEFSNTLDIEHIDYKFTKNHSSNVEDFLDNVTDYKLSDSNKKKLGEFLKLKQISISNNCIVTIKGSYLKDIPTKCVCIEIPIEHEYSDDITYIDMLDAKDFKKILIAAGLSNSQAKEVLDNDQYNIDIICKEKDTNKSKIKIVDCPIAKKKVSKKK